MRHSSIPTKLEDFHLVLDQQTKVEFLDAICGSKDSRMRLNQIFGQLQHLARQSAIDQFCNDRYV
ncbi:hypothetical protein J1N35_011547 [Gossypium stocksii]|uniref:Uncharacterized protein n=1 Tax=Gossypium stocksii TaxID=47602 RepID=A0A9D3W2N1_9ROSI|nr:hypothetical protein J1N35_011547 [Gossypium stocksii]